MAYNNTQWKELDKNTKSLQFKNKDAGFASALVLGFWNSTMTLKIHPAFPPEKRTPERVYDYQTFSMSALTVEVAKTLLKLIKKENIVEKLEDGENFEPVGTNTKSSFIEISPTCAFDSINEEGVWLNLYSKFDGEGKAAEIISYKFKNKEYFKNYAREDFTKLEFGCPVEFELFITFLNEGCKAMTNAIAHSIRNSNKYDETKAINNISKMMEKLGIVESNPSGATGGTAFFNNFGNNNANQNANFDFSTESESLPVGNDRLVI